MPLDLGIETPHYAISRPYADDELNIIHAIGVLVDMIPDDETRHRVIRYASERWGG